MPDGRCRVSRDGHLVFGGFAVGRAVQLVAANTDRRRDRLSGSYRNHTPGSGRDVTVLLFRGQL
ncbi:hypothetical protein GCM10010129_81350 [Streptomyces fumigatiscleroticus]|nr:hypothetical protein GCM10010129_81350 [Streptomyces fumigatiscleroticus]